MRTLSLIATYFLNISNNCKLFSFFEYCFMTNLNNAITTIFVVFLRLTKGVPFEMIQFQIEINKYSEYSLNCIKNGSPYLSGKYLFEKFQSLRLCCTENVTECLLIVLYQRKLLVNRNIVLN